MVRYVLAASLVLLTAGAAMADCYGWRRASDYNRSEEQWQCFECLERGHYPAANKMGAEYCITEAKQNGETVYIVGNTVFVDLDAPANSLCGCGQFVLD